MLPQPCNRAKRHGTPSPDSPRQRTAYSQKRERNPLHSTPAGSRPKLLRNRPSHRALNPARMLGRHTLDQHDPGLELSRRIVPDASRDHEKLARPHGHGSTIRLIAPNTQPPSQHEKHLVLKLVSVPGKFTLNPRHLDVLVVHLADYPRRPQLRKSSTRRFQQNRLLLAQRNSLQRQQA